MIKYSLVDSGSKGFHDDHWAIRIDEGELEGMVYQYDTVKFIPHENPEDGATLEFNTVTVDPPTKSSSLTETEIRDILGDILVNIIQENMEQVSENGTPDSE
jgi:hypothetical protein